MEVNNESVLQTLIEAFPEAVVEAHAPYGLLTVTVARNRITDALRFLKEHAQLQFVFLTDLTAVHYPELKDQEFAVVYHLHSFIHNFRLRFKVFIPSSEPTIPTATLLWESANWMERETYDYFGIIFTGHPNLIRILNMDEMDYFPMRKEYPLEDPTRRDKNDALFGR